MPSERELEQLHQRFGDFARARFEFAAQTAGFAEWVGRLMRRRGEIVLVVPRGKGRVLLHTKPHYPQGIYRLPTGGIHPDEDAEVAAKREGYEEIGFTPKTLMLLGVLDNVFSLNDNEFVYSSYVFQTETYTRKPHPTDVFETISGFRDADRQQLRDVAKQLSRLPGERRDWGIFRARSHIWLAERFDEEE